MAKRINSFLRDYVVFDLETTGVSAKKDKIIEISALKIQGGKVAKEFSTLVNPMCPIPIYASEVNNITDDMVSDSPTIDKVLPDFLAFVGDNVLLGQNIQQFDLKFIYRECIDNGIEKPDNDYADTLPISRKLLPDMPHHALSDLAAHFGISTEGAHRALADCYM
nr:3'-5' exonuclease [Lachnospiraceae bacterium]